MQDRFNQFFQTLKTLSPRQEFLNFSKNEITKQSQNYTLPVVAPVFARFRLTAALTFAAFLALIGLVGGSYMRELSPELAKSIQSEAILREAQITNFELHIDEARYYEKTAEQVALALDEIAGN